MIFFYKEIVLFCEFVRKSYGQFNKVIKAVKENPALKEYDFIYKNYKKEMKNPEVKKFYFDAESHNRSSKTKSSAYILKKWFGHLRNSFAHNYITKENGLLILRDYDYEDKSKCTLLAKISSFDSFKELVSYVKQLITERK